MEKQDMTVRFEYPGNVSRAITSLSPSLLMLLAAIWGLTVLDWPIVLEGPICSRAGAAEKGPSGQNAPADADQKNPFLRIQKTDDGQPIALQTAIVRYVPADGSKGKSVDLIGAVHIGDREYYQQLNEVFSRYDVVLYELVAPENVRPAAGQKSHHPVTGIQRTLKSVLELEFQLDQIDYSRKNFVHADMTPAEFSKSMRDRGESFLQMYFRVLGYAMATQSNDPLGSSDASFLLALFSKNRAVRLKRIMAEQFEDLDGAMSAFDGPHGSTLIGERNKKALQVLKQQWDQGERSIGIFYGAGHFSDMEQRLLDDFGLRRGQVKWLSAWDLRDPSDER